jgi:hypothetical protein
MNAQIILLASKEISLQNKYDSVPVSVGNMFPDLLRLCETADNTESYICNRIAM